MAKTYDVSKNRSEIKEIKSDLEKKKGRLEKLEEQKQQLLDAVTSIEGTKIDDDVKQVVRESINSALEANRGKGQELSSEMGQEIRRVEEIKQETMESSAEAQNRKSELERKKKLLDRFGIGGALDKATGRLETNISELGEVKDDAIEMMRELEKTSQKAGSL